MDDVKVISAKEDLNLRRRVRPDMQLYVPPAQRHRQPQHASKKAASRHRVREMPAPASETREAGDSSGTDRGSRLEVRHSPASGASDCNHEEESQIICGKLERDCVLSGPLSNKDESTKRQETNRDTLIINTKVKDEVDKEKEEMRRATEQMNRKSKSIIKYIDNTDLLKIEVSSKPDKTLKSGEDLTTWEDMFDEDGEINDVYVEEIVKHDSNEVAILETKEDHPSDQRKVFQDLDHVIELYDFPSSFKTCDIVQLYNELQCDTMYIKWVNDTHALLVLSTPTQAQRALQIQNGLVKSRPMPEASALSRSVALKHSLKPAMKRPQTSLQTARRMITTHLGAKSTISRETLEQERKLLRDAREQRRQERQNEKDAWEGNPRPSTA